jgi:hypothetical protein
MQELNARRLVMVDLQDREVVSVVRDAGAALADRPGGYTRLLRPASPGRSAEVAQVELPGSEYDPKAKAADEKAEEKPTKGVGGRLRAAADRGAARKTTMAVVRAASKPAKGVSRKRPRRERSAAAVVAFAIESSRPAGVLTLAAVFAFPRPHQPPSNPRLAEGIDGNDAPPAERRATGSRNRHTTDPDSLSDVPTARPSPGRAR